MTTTTTTPRPTHTTVCTRCHGDGYTHWMAGGVPERERCPMCGGSGRIPLPPQEGK